MTSKTCGHSTKYLKFAKIKKQSVIIISTEEIAALDVGIASAMSNVITLMEPARTDALKVSKVPTVLKVLSVYLLLNGINDDTNAILYIGLLHPTR